MAIDTYSLTYSDIRIPGQDMTRLPATSDNSLSQHDLTEAIEDVASEVFAILTRAGMQKSDLEEEGEQLAERMIKAYATKEGMRILGHSGETYDDAVQNYRDARDLLIDYLDALAGSAALTLTNVDHEDDFTFVQDRDKGEF